MAIFNSVITWIMKKRIHQIELFMKYPHDVQDEWFKKLIFAAKGTEYGKKYDFESIQNYQEYIKRVPINTYGSLKPYIDRLRLGEQNILWPSDVKWFAKSSGTTAGKSKYIPVSRHALEECHYKGGKDLLSIYLNNHPDSLIFDGRSVAMGGSHNITEVNNEEYYDGDLSAILIQNLPFWAQIMRTPNLEIALMDEWESKIEKMAWSTMQHNVTILSGVPSWTMLLMQKVLEISGEEHLKTVWPNLEVFVHGGVKFDPYRKQFCDLIGPGGINYQESYNASEGFFGIQDRSDSSEMLLMLDYGIFYEFIPMTDIEQENPSTIQLGDVEKGVNYALLISTNAGLWRYKIGDTIKFTSINPYRFVITGRTKYFINLVGEELILDNAEKALKIACKKCNAVVNEYMAGPSFGENGGPVGHEWMFEFVEPPNDSAVFADAFDNALKSVNSDYEAKRYKDLLLQPPIIHSLPSGTFYAWLKKRGKLGGQHKVPRLINQRDYIDEILKMND
ncbi:MAG: hypothetical protein GQ527_10755 [Bacteroidales bacterium]|nr:hypothetical protein [Bacteroidales bacterium]